MKPTGNSYMDPIALMNMKPAGMEGTRNLTVYIVYFNMELVQSVHTNVGPTGYT